MLVNFSWVRDGRVAGMGLPYPGSAEALREAGVGAILTLTERAPEELAEEESFARLHVPLVDFGTPSIEELERCVVWIEAQVAAGRAVAVHCFAGIGRTGTVIASWLVAGGMSPDAAVEEVRRLRPGSIETSGQVEAVRQFSERGA